MDKIEQSSSARVIRVLAFMEARFPTIGPAKNLMDFARRATSLTDSGVTAQVAIATFHRSRSSTSNEFVRACEQVGIETHVIPERSRFDVSVIPTIKKLVKSFGPDIIQTHMVKSHFLLRVTGLHHNHIWIAFHHGYTWPDMKVRIYNQLDRFSLPSAYRVVTVCSAFKSDLERIGVEPERITVRHNAVTSFSTPVHTKIKELRSTLGVTDDTQVLLSVGRLSREKGQADLIQAFSLLKSKRQTLKLLLIIVGDGPERQSLEALAARLGLSDSIVFVGYKANVGDFYALADVMALPSHTEGSPNVLLEAMAAGLPTVATSVGGVPEIAVPESNALLVRDNDPPALADMIGRLLDDTDLRAKIANGGLVTAGTYSPAAYCESILSLYRHCLSEVRR